MLISVSIKINEAYFNAGTMCAFLATNGKSSIITLHVWVDLIMLPLGPEIRMGHLASMIFSTGAISTTIVKFVPVSEVAKSVGNLKRIAVVMFCVVSVLPEIVEAIVVAIDIIKCFVRAIICYYCFVSIIDKIGRKYYLLSGVGC